MAKEIEEYFIKRLQSYLLEFLQDFSQNNMAKFSLGISSNIVLKNLCIKKQALLNFQVPLYIVDGKINQITLNMPLNYKKQQPELIVEGVDLLVCTIQEANKFALNKGGQSINDLKQHKLKLWEEQMSKYFEKLSPPNWIQKIVDSIYNNMSYIVKSFTLRFFNYSMLGYETCLRIKFDAYIRATDKDFKSNFNHDVNSTYKLIEIKKLGVSFKINPSTVLTKKDDLTILTPIDIEMKYTANRNYEHLTQPIIIQQITIKSPIIIQLNKEQKNYIIKLNEMFKTQDIIQDNFPIRPAKDVRNNYSEWWKYMIKAIMNKQKNTKLDLFYSSKKLVLMKRYIELYKRKQTIILVPWLSSWTQQDELKFSKCEVDLSLKDLLKYREWAFQEIRIEAKRYYNSSKDGQNKQSVKPLLEIWTNTINNQNAFKDHISRHDDIPIELEDDEKINLYEILERDKTNVLSSYLKGENNHPDQIKIAFTLDIHSIFILIYEYRSQAHLKYTPKNTKIFQFCQCKYHTRLLKKAGVTRAKSRQSSIHPIPKVYEEIQQQQVEENLLYSAQELDSFYEDMKDLNEDQSRQSQSSNGDEKLNNSEQKHIDDQVLSQKFVMMLNFVGIRVPLNIYQNGAIQTPKNCKDVNHIYIGDIRVIAPGMLLKIMEDKENTHFQQSPLFENRKEKQQSQKLPFQIRYSEFFNEMFDISINNDSQQFLNSELLYQTLGEFLKQNEMAHIKYFLDDYEKNKNNFQDFTLEQFKAYDKYFDDKLEQEDPSFIHIIRNQHIQESGWNKVRNIAFSKENINPWQSCDANQKHNYLQDAHNKIVDIIRRVLFIPFVEEFGEFILPVCIQNLKDKLTFINENNNKEIQKTVFSLKITLSLLGEHSEYRIVSNSDIKKNSKDPINSINQQSQVSIEFSGLQILLSTKAITSLLNFMEQKKNPIQESQTYKQCEEDHRLLLCIAQSKPLHKEVLQKAKIKFKLTLEEKLKIKIVSESLSGKIKTELRVQVKNLLISSVNLMEMSQDDDYKRLLQTLDPLKLETFYNQLKFYDINKIIVEKFSISHKYFSIDYKYYNEEMKNNEKNQQSTKVNKDVLNSPSSRNILQKSSQQLKHSSTLFNQGEHLLHKFHNSLNKSQNKIPGIKQTLLRTQVVVLQLHSAIQNHPLLTDSKLYIHVPYLEININDSAVCLFELGLIINKKMGERDQTIHQEQRYSMSKDSIMRAELLVLQNEHKKQKKDCKHCIIKYRKSLSIMNLIFGSVHKGRGNSADLFALTEQEVFLIYSRKMLNHQLKMQNQSSCKYEPKERQQGITISFLSTPKSNQSVRYTTAIQLPLLVITRDKGYFKDIIAVHCSKSQHRFELSHANSLQREKQSHPKLEKNQSFRYRAQDEIDEDCEINYIVLQPQLMVADSNDFGDKLDDKFVFYCRNKEPEMFNNEYATYEDAEHQPLFQKVSSSTKVINEPIYLLYYFHKPLRSNLLANVTENYYSEKSSKIRLFFAIESIQAKFPNQFATYNIITILKNIQTIQNIQENAYNTINKDLIKNEKEKLYLKDNPLKVLDEVIVCAIIQNIYLKSNETFFKLNQLRAFIQIHLISKLRRSSIHKRTAQSYIGPKMMSVSLTKNRSSVNSYEEDQIIRCDTIKFNFNQVSQVDIKIINVTKHKEELNLSVDDIQISIMGRQRESLLVMPGKDTGTQRASFALHINLSFSNSFPLIKTQIEQAKILLSQQKVQDLLIAINSFYLISIEEQISLKQHLLNYIFQQELIIDVKQENKVEQQTVNLFTKQINTNKKNYKFAIELRIDSLIIKLQEQDQDFFLFQFHQIVVNKKNNSNLYFSLQQIELRPQNENSDKLIYPNLIEPIDNCQDVVMSLENKVIQIQNVKIFLISKYINELEAFKSRIEEILQKNLDELKEKYQKDFDLQLQIKQQEDFQRAEGYFNYKIEISRSQFVIPESSLDSNCAIVTFSQAALSLNKQKQSYKIPDLCDTEVEVLKNNLIVDYNEKITTDYGEFFVAKIEGVFQDVIVQYQFHTVEKLQGQLLEASKINLRMDLPSFDQNKGQLEWTLKNQCRIDVTNLQMGLDFGKMLKVQGILEKNQAELSSLFKFQRKMLEKINFQMKLENYSEICLVRLNQGDQEKLQQVKEQAKVYKHRPRLSRAIQNKSQSRRESLI